MTFVIAHCVGLLCLPTGRSLSLLHAVFVSKCNAWRCIDHYLCCVSFPLHIALQACKIQTHTAMHKQTVTGGCKMFHNERDKFYLS